MPNELMLAAPVPQWSLVRGMVAEPKWDGFRILLARYSNGHVRLQSRRGTDMTAGFPEIAAAATADSRGDVLLDGELVVWSGVRLTFERLAGRLNRRPAAVRQMAVDFPASRVVFDLLHWDEPYVRRPWRERRAALEQLFAECALGAPWTLCPVTDDETVARRWLEDWGALRHRRSDAQGSAGAVPPGSARLEEVADPAHQRGAGGWGDRQRYPAAHRSAR